MNSMNSDYRNGDLDRLTERNQNETNASIKKNDYQAHYEIKHDFLITFIFNNVKVFVVVEDVLSFSQLKIGWKS